MKKVVTATNGSMDTYLEQNIMEAAIATTQNNEGNAGSGLTSGVGLKRKLSSVKGGENNSVNQSGDEATENKRRKSSRNSTAGTVRPINFV